MQRNREQQDVGGEEPVSDGDETRARQRLHEISIGDVEQQHANQRAGEEPLQIVDAAGDPHLIADRTHDVIGRQDREDVEPGPAQYGCFAGPGLVPAGPGRRGKSRRRLLRRRRLPYLVSLIDPRAPCVARKLTALCRTAGWVGQIPWRARAALRRVRSRRRARSARRPSSRRHRRRRSLRPAFRRIDVLRS